MRKFFILITSLLYFLGSVEFCLAAEEHGKSGAPLWLSWVNFTLYVLIIYFLVRRPFARAWQQRIDLITEKIRQADGEHAKAQSLLNDALRKTSTLEGDVLALKQEIESETEAERKQLLLEAEKKAKRILERADDSSAIELKHSELQLRRAIGNKALGIARDRFSKEHDAASDRRMRDESVAGYVKYSSQVR